jgi:hypothetical protein
LAGDQIFRGRSIHPRNSPRRCCLQEGSEGLLHLGRFDLAAIDLHTPGRQDNPPVLSHRLGEIGVRLWSAWRIEHNVEHDSFCLIDRQPADEIRV